VLRLLSEAKQSPQYAFLKLFETVIFPGLRDQVSHQQKTKDAIKILPSLIVTFVESTPEDKTSGLNVCKISKE
jgi:hypothetical protein